MSTQWLVGTAGILAVAVGLGAETRNDTSPVAELGQGAASPTIVVRPGHLPTGRFSEQTAPNNAQDTGALNDAVRRTCVTCHNDRMRRGGLSLEDFRVEDAPPPLHEVIAHFLVHPGNSRGHIHKHTKDSAIAFMFFQSSLSWRLSQLYVPCMQSS